LTVEVCEWNGKNLYGFSLIGNVVLQGYSQVPPELPNSTAQQPRQTRQKGAHQ